MMQIEIISADHLIVQLKQGADYSIVDARTSEEFGRGHVKGAVSMLWEEWCRKPPTDCAAALTEPGYWGLLADPVAESFAERLSAAGLSNSKPVAVYADGPASKGREGRIGWMLLYLGAEKIFLLDGGWSVWLNADGETEFGAATKRKAGDFRIDIHEKRRVMFAQLKESLQDNSLPLMVDTRTHNEFAGRCYDYQPRKGRLPNSLLIPFKDLFAENGLFISKEPFLERCAQQINGADNIVTYCEVGVRAAAFALMYEMYTGKVVPVFDGSVMQWAYDHELPMVVEE